MLYQSPEQKAALRTLPELFIQFLVHLIDGLARIDSQVFVLIFVECHQRFCLNKKSKMVSKDSPLDGKL